MTAVLGLLGFQPNTTHGAQQRGLCPLHGSTSGTSRCFHCLCPSGKAA